MKAWSWLTAVDEAVASTSSMAHGASQCTTGLLPVAAIDISELLLSYELLRRFCESIRCAPAKAGTTLTGLEPALEAPLANALAGCALLCRYGNHQPTGS